MFPTKLTSVQKVSSPINNNDTIQCPSKTILKNSKFGFLFNYTYIHMLSFAPKSNEDVLKRLITTELSLHDRFLCSYSFSIIIFHRGNEEEDVESTLHIRYDFIIIIFSTIFIFLIIVFIFIFSAIIIIFIFSIIPILIINIIIIFIFSIIIIIIIAIIIFFIIIIVVVINIIIILLTNTFLPINLENMNHTGFKVNYQITLYILPAENSCSLRVQSFA